MAQDESLTIRIPKETKESLRSIVDDFGLKSLSIAAVLMIDAGIAITRERGEIVEVHRPKQGSAKLAQKRKQG